MLSKNSNSKKNSKVGRFRKIVRRHRRLSFFSDKHMFVGKMSMQSLAFHFPRFHRRCTTSAPAIRCILPGETDCWISRWDDRTPPHSQSPLNNRDVGLPRLDTMGWDRCICNRDPKIVATLEWFLPGQSRQGGSRPSDRGQVNPFLEPLLDLSRK